jgi:hypothetical protein
MSGVGLTGLDSSVLLSYFNAQLSSSTSSIAAANAQNTALAATQNSNSATANDNPPWNTPNTNDAKQDAQVLSTTNFMNTSNVPLTAGATSDSKMEQDNQKLFSLYSAVNTLAYIAKMAQSSTATSGQLAGLNDRFQTGLAQVQQYLSSTTFNNFTLQAASSTDTATSTATIPFSDYTYQTRQLTTNANLNSPLSGVSASDSFTIAVKKGNTTTNVAIDLSQVTGGLTLGNIITYINGQLAAGGFSTRLQKTQQGGTTTSDATATYGLQVTPGANETISFSSASATPALYLAGNSGSPNETSTVTNSATSAATTTAADQTGRLTKLSGIDGSPTGVLSVNQQASTGTTTAQNTVVDSSGNVYVIGTATGDFGSQLNQGSQDVYLTKYDSAGNQTWSKLLGSGGSASGYGLALDPSGGVVVTGATTADLTTTSVADGNNDSFVARYDASGNQTWIKQIQTLATNQANSVSVDASGNIYIGGSVSGGVIGAGQTSQGKGDAYLAKFNSSGKLLAENQFGTSGADSVGATATDSSGNLYVASVQNGDAVISKYANGDITSAPVWIQDLGALQGGGAVSGLAVSNGQVYVSGTTSNANLTAGGSATVAAASSGGTDAFVFNLTDNGTTATANHVTYVGTAASEQGAAVTVGPDGTVYLTGTTLGTFSGQQRNVQNVNNAFATAINTDGSIQWIRQYGGQDGQSTGTGVAVDPNGASVLDALGLPRGTLTFDQSVDLTTQTTLRAGDSFQIKIEGTAPRTTTITIDPGETLDSLSTKINAQLGSLGKASVSYTGNAEGLSIKVNAGTTIQLISGPTDLDALSRLGITAGILTSPAKTGTTTTTTTTSSTTPAYGLGFSGTLDISTKTGADLARSQLLTVLSSLQSTYQTTNKPAALPTTPGNTSGTVSADTTSQLANYNLALSLLQGASSSSSSSSSVLSLF